MKGTVRAKYLGFYKRKFPGTPYLSLSAHALQKIQVWLRSVSNEGHFTWRATYVIVCISACARGIFLELHTFHFSRMRYKRLRFLFYRSIMKSTLLGEESTFFVCILASNRGIFLERRTFHFTRMHY